MKLRVVCTLALVLCCAARFQGQVARISFPAGTPEDRALQEIAKETDAGKREAALRDFVEKFSGNPSAVAYGYSQLAQHYQNLGNTAQALVYGEKALAVVPNNLELLVAHVSVAQQAQDWGKVVEHSARGGTAVNGIGKQPKPEGMSAEDFASRVEQERENARPLHEFLETAAINAIASVQDPKQRFAYIEQFNAAFPGSRFQEQVAQYAVYALQQVNDLPRLATFGEKALAANPENLPMLAMLAAALAEDPMGVYLARAGDYARKAIAVAKADAPDADRSRKLLAGVAHSALGYVLLRQEKTAPAIAELKAASVLLKDDANARSTVLYRLGFAYAKLKRYGEAREVLQQAVAIPGPFQQPSRELLSKVNAAR